MNDPSDPKTWGKNLAVCLIENASGELVLHEWNDPKRGHPVTLHSEGKLMRQWERMRREDKTTRVMQVFSERFPCGERSNNCYLLLTQSPNNVDPGKIFFLTSEHEDRGYRLAMAYFRTDIASRAKGHVGR